MVFQKTDTEVTMPNGQCKAMSPRIARMMCELEGPPEEPEVAAPRLGSRSDGNRAPLARERRVLATVLLVVGATIVMAMVAGQARTPVDHERHVALDTERAPSAFH